MEICNFSDVKYLKCEIFKMCKKTNPNVVTIWGGPNFPIDFPSQKKFMERYKEVDNVEPRYGDCGGI